MSLVRIVMKTSVFALGFNACFLPDTAAQTASDTSLVSVVAAAFTKPHSELVPPILIFPPVGADNHIRNDDSSLRQMAAFAVAYGPQRRMSICVPYVEDVLNDAGCWLPDATLDDETIRLCLAASDNPSYAVPTIVEQAGRYNISLRFTSNGGDFADKTFDQSFEQHQLGKVPGWIARTLLEHTGYKPSTQELELLNQSQFGGAGDLEELTTWRDMPASASADVRMLTFLDRNPDCILTWEAYLSRAQDAAAALHRFEEEQPAKRSERLQLSAAVRLRELGRPREAVLSILELIPTHYDDTYFYSTLFKCALALEDRDLVKLVLAEWKKAAPGYADSVYRARVLSDWAWAARGGGWAHEVDSEDWRLFQTRLTAAHRELEHAVSVNPDGWVAHARLIGTGRDLSLPRQFVDEHFAAATKLRPKYAGSYRSKFNYLMPRWLGTPAELVAFGKECFETGYWETRIPQFLFEAIQDAHRDPTTSEYSPEPFRSPELWELISTYRREAVPHINEAEQRLIANHYALWGALGGHYGDVAELFSQLQYDYADKFVDTSVFPDFVNLLSMAEEVSAATKTGSEQTFLPIRADLANRRFSEASDKLNELKPNDIIESSNLQFFRRALEIGKSMEAQRELNITGMQWKYAFAAIRSREFTHTADGEVLDGNFVWPAEPLTNAEMLLVFPCAFPKATLEGTFRWTPGITYVEISWRQRTTQSVASLRLYPEGNSLVLVQGFEGREQIQLPSSPVHFKITIGDELDLVQVNEEINLQLFVEPPELGTFSIRAMTNVENPGKFTIEDFKITLD